MIIRQCELQSGDSFATLWLDDRPELKTGVRVTLKDEPDRLWTVLSVGKPHESGDVDKQRHFRRHDFIKKDGSWVNCT